LEELFFMGFRRLSLGVQDFDLNVQTAIHRIQTPAQVQKVTELARGIGYRSINFDLIYGLPKQTRISMTETIERVLDLMPDRIAFYSYAHVPWVSPGQRGYSEADLPADAEKRELYELGKELFLGAGYKEIGMDHFALVEDPLCKADANGTLHRNFMGYTTQSTRMLLGLGVSSISDSWTAFAQNEKKVEDYMDRVNRGELAVFRGHVLSEEDLVLRQHILNLMCRHRTDWNKTEMQHGSVTDGISRMQELLLDGLVEQVDHTVVVTDKGKPFVRNICMAMDARMWRNQPTTQIFSSTV
jgi:oxygen-independent coproporphyrinogen-3 oxidase